MTKKMTLQHLLEQLSLAYKESFVPQAVFFNKKPKFTAIKLDGRRTNFAASFKC